MGKRGGAEGKERRDDQSSVSNFTSFTSDICSKQTVWLAAIILGRDIALGFSAIYYRWISLPAPKTLTRFWDFSLPSAEVRPTQISKYNTFLQLALMGLTTVAPVMGADLSTPLSVMQ